MFEIQIRVGIVAALKLVVDAENNKIGVDPKNSEPVARVLAYGDTFGKWIAMLNRKAEACRYFLH